jgi:hypothetical protein
MTELEAQAKDYAMSRKLNLSEPTDITHVIELIEKAYIEGSKSKWHDLRKNPGDLPSPHKEYLSKVVVINNGMEAYYDHNNGQWYDAISDWLVDEEVLAWCDYPKYEETEEKPAV